MRGFGFLLFGGISSLGLAVSTAILRHVFRSPPQGQLQLKNGDEKLEPMQENNETIQAVEENKNLPFITEKATPQATTPLLKMMADENRTDFTYDSTEYADRYGEDFYSQRCRPESPVASPESPFASPDSKASKLTIETGSFSDDDAATDIGDNETISEEVFSEHEEPANMEEASTPAQDTPGKERDTDPEMPASIFLTEANLPTANTEPLSSDEGSLVQTLSFPTDQVTPIKERPITRTNVDTPRSTASSMAGSIEPYCADLLTEDTSLLFTPPDMNLPDETTASDVGMESPEPYIKELLADYEAMQTPVDAVPQDKVIQTDETNTLSSQSTPTKDSESKVHGSPANAPPRADEMSGELSSSGAFTVEHAATPVLVRPVSAKRMAVDTYVSPLSSRQRFDDPVSNRPVSIMPIPLPKTWPQPEEKVLEIGRQESSMGGVVQMSSGEGVGEVGTLTGTEGPSVATGIVQTGATVRSSGLLPTIGGRGKENMERRKSGFGGRRISSRGEEERGSKRFRFAEKIRMRPLRARTNSSK